MGKALLTCSFCGIPQTKAKLVTAANKVQICAGCICKTCVKEARQTIIEHDNETEAGA